MKNLTLSLDISTTATGWALFEGSDLGTGKRKDS